MSAGNILITGVDRQPADIAWCEAVDMTDETAIKEGRNARQAHVS